MQSINRARTLNGPKPASDTLRLISRKGTPIVKQVFIVGSDKGGVGKTEIALQLIFRLREEGRKPAIAEVDSVQRLSMILRDQVDVSIRVKPEMLAELEEGGDAAMFFRPLLSVIAEDTEHDCAVIDLGATISGQFLSWLEAQEVIEIIRDFDFRPVFVGVSAPEAASLSGALRYLSAAQKVAEEEADYALVFNDTIGSGFAFVDAIDEVRERLEKLAETQPVQHVIVPHAKRSQLISLARRNAWGLHEAFALANDALQLTKKGHPFEARHSELVKHLELANLTRPERRMALSYEVKVAMKWLLSARDAVGEMISTPAESVASEQEEGETDAN